MADKKMIVQILEKLRSSFHPAPDISPETWRRFRDGLSDIDPNVLMAASLLLAKTVSFFPSIAAIREACAEVSGDRAKLPSVGESYAEARRCASSIGAYVTPTGDDFSHEIVYQAIVQSSGSWRRWCLTDDSDQVSLRSRFFQVYTDLLARERLRLSIPEAQRHLTAEESRQILSDLEMRKLKA